MGLVNWLIERLGVSAPPCCSLSRAEIVGLDGAARVMETASLVGISLTCPLRCSSSDSSFSIEDEAASSGCTVCDRWLASLSNIGLENQSYGEAGEMVKGICGGTSGDAESRDWGGEKLSSASAVDFRRVVRGP